MTQEEQDFAEKVLETIPEGSVVINNPGDGSLLLYGVDGMRCYYRTASGYEEGETEESKLIRTDLKDIETNEAVRAAVNEIGAKYVLVLDASNFKESFLSITRTPESAFRGITEINDDTPVFKVVLAEDSMRLYEMCSNAWMRTCCRHFSGDLEDIDGAAFSVLEYLRVSAMSDLCFSRCTVPIS